MYRLLIADDEETIRQGLKKLITSYDLNFSMILMAKDGEEALDAIRNYLPEIICMDINMPFMNGLEVIEKAKILNPQAKIIIISGYDHFEYAQKALDLGVYRYILKPISFREFKKTLLGAIEAYDDNQMLLYGGPHAQKEEENPSISKTALSYLKANYDHNDLSLKKMADDLNVSSSYLAKVIKDETGLTFTDQLTKLRMSLAIKFLLNPKKSSTIHDIALKVGYSSQHYFSRLFKSYTGLSPNQYKKNHQTKKEIMDYTGEGDN